MVITLGAELEAALTEEARQRGMAPEALALKVLRACFRRTSLPEPRDEWEQRLLGLAKDCGISLPDPALRRESIYD
jgi:hypothetical protein